MPQVCPGSMCWMCSAHTSTCLSDSPWHEVLGFRSVFPLLGALFFLVILESAITFYEKPCRILTGNVLNTQFENWLLYSIEPSCLWTTGLIFDTQALAVRFTPRYKIIDSLRIGVTTVVFLALRSLGLLTLFSGGLPSAVVQRSGSVGHLSYTRVSGKCFHTSSCRLVFSVDIP